MKNLSLSRVERERRETSSSKADAEALPVILAWSYQVQISNLGVSLSFCLLGSVLPNFLRPFFPWLYWNGVCSVPVQRDLAAVLCHGRCARCDTAAWLGRFTHCSCQSSSFANTSHSSLSHRKQDFLSCRCPGWENPSSAGLCTDCLHSASTRLCLHACSLNLFKLPSHDFLLSPEG